MDRSTMDSGERPGSAAPAEKTREAASTAAEGGKEVARAAGEGAQQVVGTVKEQASEVRQQVASEARNLVGEAKGQLHGQARSQTEQLAGGIRRMADQVRSLAEGRADEAGQVGDYARQAASKLSDLSSTVEQRGFDGLIDDVQRFARRRPGAFLGAAAITGFAVGRLLRGAKSQDGDGDGSQSPFQQSASSPGPLGAPTGNVPVLTPAPAGGPASELMTPPFPGNS